MSVFDETIGHFSDDDQKKIEVLLARWELGDGRGRKIVANMRADHFIPVDRMKCILKRLLEVHDKSITDVQGTYVNECYKHVLQGGVVCSSMEFPLPDLVGRAADREEFRAKLWETLGAKAKLPNVRYFASVQQVDGFINKLILGGALSPAEIDLPMSEYACWVTWTEKRRADPFSFLSLSIADEARACLGLNPQFTGELLLLTFERAALPDLLRPTIADAGEFEYFRPPPPQFKLHGWSDPWLQAVAKIRPNPVTCRLLPRPEAVHQKTTFRSLKMPVRRLP